MTDKEIYEQIEQSREEADALYEKLHEQVENSIVNHAKAKKRRRKLMVSILPVAVVLVITLAIVLPIVLQPQDQETRYSDSDILLPDVLDCKLKEYYAKNNLSLLYLDWYEYAEGLLTTRYYEEGKENQTVYLYEEYTDGYWGYFVKLTVMKRNIVVETLENKLEEPQTTNIGNVQITYALQRNSSYAKFEYQGYKYYLEINDGLTLEFLVETIESMFNN